MMDAEGAYWYHAHPRTKGTTGYPDLIFDNSEARMCEWRCFDAVDTMNNLYTNSGLRPKNIIADIDTYRKRPEDDTYANFPVNYLKLDADVEWTYPLKFVEVVWGDGKKVDRQIISATDTGAFGSRKFSIPFDAAGKSWVRFAVWDSAGDGGFVQPIRLNASKTTN